MADNLSQLDLTVHLSQSSLTDLRAHELQKYGTEYNR